MCPNIQIQHFRFLVVIWYLLLKSGDIEINPGPTLPYALMMKELELFDSRIKILHQSTRNLAGRHRAG